MRATIIVASLMLALGGCKTKDKWERALDKSQEFRDKMCACQDKSCADAVQKDYLEWSRVSHEELRGGEQTVPSQNEFGKALSLEIEMRACRHKLDPAAPQW